MKTAQRILAAVLLATALGVAGAPAQAGAVTGVLSGLVVTDSGAPAANVDVTARRSTDGAAQFGRTGADGSYRFDPIEPGQYFVEFSPSTGMRQYAPGKRYSNQAETFEVRAGEQTVVNETLFPRGNVAGRFVDFDGAPLAGAFVNVSGLDGDAFGFTRTDANGAWRIDGVYAMRYRVNFSSDVIQQAAFGKVGKANPDIITVAANTTTTVNDTAIARTSIRVTATNALTGAALTNFSIFAGPRFGSTETGELILDQIQAGTHFGFVSAEGFHAVDLEVTAVLGEQRHLAVVLTPSSAITARVVDAATGAPIPGVCIGAFNSAHAVVGDALCAEQTDEQGNLTVHGLREGTYQLLALPGFETPAGYGGQWVGPNGGTGLQTKARSVTIATGQTVTVPDIKLDRAGIITGHVSTPDGQVPRFGSVNVLSGHPIVGSSLGVQVGDDGKYTIDFLGPYDWPLLFEASGQAAQWGGNVADRRLARTVKVTKGATVTYDFRFQAGVNVTMTAPEVSWVLYYNAFTGDIMGAGSGGLTNDITALVFSPQYVKVQIWPNEGNPYWLGGADFAHARPYLIRGSNPIHL